MTIVASIIDARKRAFVHRYEYPSSTAQDVGRPVLVINELSPCRLWSSLAPIVGIVIAGPSQPQQPDDNFRKGAPLLQGGLLR